MTSDIKLFTESLSDNESDDIEQNQNQLNNILKNYRNSKLVKPEEPMRKRRKRFIRKKDIQNMHATTAKPKKLRVYNKTKYRSSKQVADSAKSRDEPKISRSNSLIMDFRRL